MTRYTPEAKKKYLADVQLGRLTKWLRLLGFDTAYYKSASLFTMSRIAKQEGRIFLTRSRKNARSKLFEAVVLIHSAYIDDQLQELLKESSFTHERMFTRCSLCNQTLNDIEKEKVVSLVPDYVYRNNDHFKLCRKCGRVYWKGTHHRAVLEKLAEILN